MRVLDLADKVGRRRRMTRYFSLNFSVSMLPSAAIGIRKKELTIEEAKQNLNCQTIYSVHSSYKPTLLALEKKHGIKIPVSDSPPWIKMKNGDSIIILQISNLPRIGRDEEYKEEEIANAVFSFIQIDLVWSRPIHRLG